MGRTVNSAVVLLSGGLDSTVLTARALGEFDSVLTLGINYGQRHRVELEHAARAALELGVDFKVADLSKLASLLPGSSQTDASIDVPDGHYADETMRATVVPNRNMVMLSVAAGYAIAHGAETVLYAAHAGDCAVYPDCRPVFISRLRAALEVCHYEPGVELFAPFASMTKASIVLLGVELGAPIGLTWSCYKGGVVHCGTCGTCVERREAFLLAGVADPTAYA